MTASHAPALAAMLQQAQPDADARVQLRRLARRTLVPLLVAAALAGVWSTAAPLSGALKSVVTHLVYGVGLYLAARATAAVAPG